MRETQARRTVPLFIGGSSPRIRHLWESPIESRVSPLPLSFYFPVRMKDVRRNINFTPTIRRLKERSGNLVELRRTVTFTCDLAS